LFRNYKSELHVRNFTIDYISLECSANLVHCVGVNTEAMSDSKTCKATKEDFPIFQLSGNISPVVKKCLSQIIEDQGFLNYNVNIKDISTNGGNYLATLQEIDLTGKSLNGDKEINLFLKNRLNSDDFKLLPLDEVYIREAFYYNELTKIYNQLQEDANIPEAERFQIVKTYIDSNSEVTILDNLTKKGYTTCDRPDVISVDFAEMSIKQLAKFHALSFVLKNNMPDFFQSRIKAMKSLFSIQSEFKGLLEKLFNESLTFLDSESRSKIENYLPVMLDSYIKFVNRGADEAVCLCHGDFRPNNVMLIEKVSRNEFLFYFHYDIYISPCYNYSVKSYEVERMDEKPSKKDI
jgi:hypothetical protein